MKQYFQLATTGRSANLTIYGDITSWPWKQGDVSAANLSAQLAALEDVDNINVYINSYGGEVAEGLAIYNALKRHKARVVTYCDGMACSIASVIFMAGDERHMNKASLLMIHNAWTFAEGNAEELRKQADDLEKITSASVAAYMTHFKHSERKLREMMDAETWLTPKEAVKNGFATHIDEEESEHPEQSARKHIFERFLAMMQEADEAPESAENDVDDEDEEVIVPDDENGENGDSAPENNDSENEDSSETENDEETEENTPEKEAVQRWNGFFNALNRR